MSVDVDIEALIDRAGRERVFEIAHRLGWRHGDAVPAYVWREIAVNLIEDGQWTAGMPPQTLGESLGLGQLFGDIFG